MNNDETFEFENRVYVNPDISRDEQTAFVDTLRDLQAQKNAQIATETHNLGTDVPSHLGGLSGSEEYFQRKYQTPQTEAMAAELKAVAQQSALNTALQNYQDTLQNKYNQAYRAYQKRVYNHNRNSGGSGGNGDNKSTWDGTIDLEALEELLKKSSEDENNDSKKYPNLDDYTYDDGYDNGMPEYLRKFLDGKEYTFI